MFGRFFVSSKVGNHFCVEVGGHNYHIIICEDQVVSFCYIT